VTSVTSDFGTTLSYSYDAQGRLSQVTQPDSTTIAYTYNTQSQIISVTDFNGKVIEAHTYDSAGHGLTASQATEANGPAPTSRDICAKGLAEEKAKSPHKILRKEFYVECSCGFKGPALNDACRKCGAQISFLPEIIHGIGFV
jgi:YD repeat-containing protein